MPKRRVCVVITARPSYSRIKTAVEAIRDHEDLELQLVVAASALLDRYGSAIDQIEADGFKIDAHVYMVLEARTPRRWRRPRVSACWSWPPSSTTSIPTSL